MSPDTLYHIHVDNVRAVSAGLDRVALTLRQSVASNDLKNTETYLRLYALLLAAWAESRLAKLLYEPGAFSETDRDQFRAEATHLDRWKKVVEVAFRNHYNVPRAALSATTLSHSAFSRYTTLIDLLSTDLHSIITLRNKLAHGQWVYPLTGNGSSIAQEQMDALRHENTLTIQLKRKLIAYLLDTVQDLTVSKRTFERDFDKHFRGIAQLRQQVRNKPYIKYVAVMRERFGRGQAKRRGGPD